MAIIVCGHGWLTLRLFPSWHALVNDQPVISVDHAIHLYHGYLGAKFLKEHGTSWGYDPYFMAGYPKTPVYDSSSGPAELFQLVVGGSYSPRAYKIGTSLLVGLIPIVIAMLAWGYGFRSMTVVAAVVGAVCYWWGGFADTLVRTGLVAFVWASALAVLVPGLYVRWAQHRGWKDWAALNVATAVGIQAHSIFPLMVAAPLLLGYIWVMVGGCPAVEPRAARPGWRWHFATWGALALALLASSFWWVPLLEFLPLKEGSELFMAYRGNTLDSLAKRVGDWLLQYYLLHDAFIPLLLVFVGTIGLVHWCVIGRGIQAGMQGVQIAVLGLLTFAGSEWQVTRNLEPLRFQVPLGLSLCLPAGAGGVFLVSRLNPRCLAGRTRERLAWAGASLTIGFAVIVTVPSLWWARVGFNPNMQPPSTWQSTARRLSNARPLAIGLRPEMTELVEWIRQNTDDSCRILFEDQLRLLERDDPSAPESIHWTPLLPLLTGRQFIGGLYHLAFIPHRRAAFGDWSLAGRNIRDWSSDELRAFLEQYNIGWVITWSHASPLKQRADRFTPLSTDVFASLAFCEVAAKIRRHSTRPDEDEYTIFRVVREPNYCAKGHARVVGVDYNRIELADLEPDQGEVVLRYHWQSHFTADPPVRLRHAESYGDPVGFIRISLPEPLDRLTLINAY